MGSGDLPISDCLVAVLRAEKGAGRGRQNLLDIGRGAAILPPGHGGSVLVRLGHFSKIVARLATDRDPFFVEGPKLDARS